MDYQLHRRIIDGGLQEAKPDISIERLMETVRGDIGADVNRQIESLHRRHIETRAMVMRGEVTILNVAATGSIRLLLNQRVRGSSWFQGVTSPACTVFQEVEALSSKYGSRFRLKQTGQICGACTNYPLGKMA